MRIRIDWDFTFTCYFKYMENDRQSDFRDTGWRHWTRILIQLADNLNECFPLEILTNNT